jgi:hypothetical protein
MISPVLILSKDGRKKSSREVIFGETLIGFGTSTNDYSNKKAGLICDRQLLFGACCGLARKSAAICVEQVPAGIPGGTTNAPCPTPGKV